MNKEHAADVISQTRVYMEVVFGGRDAWDDEVIPDAVDVSIQLVQSSEQRAADISSDEKAALILEVEQTKEVETFDNWKPLGNGDGSQMAKTARMLESLGLENDASDKTLGLALHERALAVERYVLNREAEELAAERRV